VSTLQKMKVYNYTELYVTLSYVSITGKKAEVTVGPYGNAELLEPVHVNIDGIYKEVRSGHKE